MNKLPISVCLISGAEAQRIGRTLESVAGWTSEIVVVLNEDVRDGTEEIAQQHGAKVFREPWKGYVAQKNSAAQKVTQEWVLGLDTDEVVSPELRQEIQGLFATRDKLEPFAAFSFPRLTLFCGRWIRHGDWYPDRGTRLWRRGRAEWAGGNIHEKLQVNGPTGKLRGNLLHYNATRIDEQISKITLYSDAFALDALQQRRAGWFGLMIRPGWRFLRAYIFRLGFLDGWQGLIIAQLTAFYTFLRYAKVREAQTQVPTEPIE
jgi:glycosyltransferase involved in cell wall biosynthesis